MGRYCKSETDVTVMITNHLFQRITTKARCILNKGASYNLSPICPDKCERKLKNTTIDDTTIGRYLKVFPSHTTLEIKGLQSHFHYNLKVLNSGHIGIRIICDFVHNLLKTVYSNNPHAFLKKRRGYCNRLRLSVRYAISS